VTPAPVGAQCARHPTVPAMGICPRCGSFACANCDTWDATGRRVCLSCRTVAAPLATRGSRLLAHIVDNLVLAGPGIVFMVIAAVFVVLLTKNDPESLAVLAIYPAMGLGFLLGAGAQLWSQIATGQSVGKRALGIKVQRLDGSEVDILRLIFLRNVVVAFAVQLCGLVGLVDALMIFGADQRCLHDLIADTKVVVAEREPAPFPQRPF